MRASFFVDCFDMKSVDKIYVKPYLHKKLFVKLRSCSERFKIIQRMILKPKRSE